MAVNETHKKAEDCHMGLLSFDYNDFWTEFGDWVSRQTPKEALLAESISRTQYLSWASEHFGFPVLKEEFFWRSEGERSQMLADLKDHHSEILDTWVWNDLCVPIAYFEETVMVACIYPPAEQAAHVQYLITSPENLSKAWELWQKVSFHKDPQIRVLSQLTPYYRASLWGQVDPLKQILKPVQWHRFTLPWPPQEAPEIPLDQHSPFRVAYTTKKPYHGYVLPNSVLDSFCNSFNNGTLLENLTVVPLCDEYQNECRGLLIALPGKDFLSKESLILAEATAKDLYKLIIDDVSKKSAA